MAGEMKEFEKTVLGSAILNGDIKHVKRLVEEGEDVHYMDRKENTYLHFLATMHRPYIFHILVSAGIDINHQNRDGNTALHVTALQDETGHLVDLMMRGVNPYILNKRGRSAKEEVSTNKFWLDLYHRYEPGLYKAIDDHDIERVTHLLNGWCDVTSVRDGRDMRQFAAHKKYHDIVAVIDKVRISLMTIFGVLELDYKKLKYSVVRPECNVNFLLQTSGCHPCHILQHAIHLQEPDAVELLMQNGCDVNTMVQVKGYIRGPLYFEAIHADSGACQRIRKAVINKSADTSLKDERGRSCLTFAIDRSSADATVDLAQYFLENGVDIALRDDTGCSARDVALLARRHDVIKLIDEHLVEIIKSSNMTRIHEMAMHAYDDFFIQLRGRDSWIYAAGNDSEDVTDFLNSFTQFRETSLTFHKYIKSGSIDRMKLILHDRLPDDHSRICHSRDKGGRGVLIKSVLYQQMPIFKWILEISPDLVLKDIDNLGRNALHYAVILREKGEQFMELLLTHGADQNVVDCSGRKPSDMQNLDADKLNEILSHELKVNYGIDQEIRCVSKYEELLRVIVSKKQNLKDFDNVLKKLKYPAINLPQLFHPQGHRLVSRYRDLLLAAIDYGKEDIARKLIRLGADCTWKEDYHFDDGRVISMNALERAQFVNNTSITECILQRNLKQQSR